MKKSMITGLFCLSIFWGITQNQIDLQPIEKKNPVLIISGKNTEYYSLDKNKPLEFLIEGADSLIIRSVKRMSENNDLEAFNYTYQFDQTKEIDIKSPNIFIDQNAAYINKTINKRPSKRFEMTVLVPDSAKIISIFQGKKSGHIDVNITAYFGKEKKNISPMVNTQRNNIISGKSFKYYKINSDIPTIIKLKDAGKLIVYTRKRLTKNDTKGYSFNYNDRFENKKTITIKETKPSKKSTYKSMDITEFPSTYTKTVIDIPSNYGEIIFTSKDPIDARFVFIKKTGDSKWKEIKPLNPLENIYLKYKESGTIAKYYRITKNRSFEFQITGPKKIRLLTRGEFEFDMHSNNDYEIILKEGEKIVNTFKLSCFRSSKTEYKDNDEMIPGSLDILYINIPEGKHNYSLHVNNNAKSALIRVSEIIDK